MRQRPKLGDVFVVPLDDGKFGVGQVVGTYGKESYFFAIFDVVIPLEHANRQAVEAVDRPVLFLALSMDAKLYAGHWRVVGQEPVPPEVPLPAYKEAVGSPPNFEVVDYSGTRRRPATAAEAHTLPNRKVVAPVRVEKALRAHLGLEPWLDAFNELRPEGRATTADLFNRR
nr:Imm26 family immunity protein [Agromyces sp. Soil535]